MVLSSWLLFVENNYFTKVSARTMAGANYLRY